MTTIKTLLTMVKEASPMTYSFLKAIQDKFVDFFMAGVPECEAMESDEVNTPKPVMRTEMTPSRFFKKRNKPGDFDILTSRAQVMIKLLTEHLNKFETFNRFLVEMSYIVLGEFL